MSRRRQHKNWAKSAVAILFTLLGACYLWLHPQPGPASLPEGTLEVHFIDVGQGDAILVRCGEEAMLIDGGTANSGTRLQLYLRKLNIQSLTYVVGTHPDADHIGGLATVLYNFDTETVLMTDREANTRVYDNLMETMRSRRYVKTIPEAGQTYSLGEGTFTILGPLREAEDSNNESIALRLQFGEISFLFCGDAEEEEEEELTQYSRTLQSTVYKVNHHGSSSSSSWDFLRRVKPKYAVISCGVDNDYGHPHKTVLERLDSINAEVFRTDQVGTVVASTDGKEIIWSFPES